MNDILSPADVVQAKNTWAFTVRFCNSCPHVEVAWGKHISSFSPNNQP